MGNGVGSSQQFSIPPQTEIIVNPGLSPSMGPVFNFGQNQFNNHVTGIYFSCYNQCISTYGTAGVWMDHISTAIQNTGQGIQHGASFMADNVGIAIYDTFWVGCDYCNLDGYAGNTTLPVLLFAGVTPLVGGRNISGLWLSRGGIWESGNILYDQRVTQNAAPGNFHFIDLTLEEPGNNLPLMQVTNEAASGDLDGVVMDQVNMSDSSSAPSSAIQLDANFTYSDFELNNVQIGFFTPAILLNSGTMLGCQMKGSASMARNIVNGSGQLVAGCVGANNYGLDMVSSSSDTGPASLPYITNMNYGAGFFGSNNTSTPIRMTSSGNKYATFGISPVGGIVYSGGNASGYDVELYRPSVQTLGIRLAQTVAPTGLSSALSSGGSLNSGTTYFYVVEANMVASTCLAANSTGTSTETSATPGSGNLTINLSWTPSPGTPAGYCVYRGTSSGGENVFFYVAGNLTANFSDTGTTGTAGGPAPVNATFPTTSQHVFNQTSLGVNTSTPAYNLDVNGNGHIFTYVDVNEIATPANPPSGLERWYANFSTHQLSCITSSGSSCAPTGGGGGFTAGQDLSGTSTAQTVIGLETIPLPTLAASTGFLYDNAGTLALSTSASNLTTGTLPHTQLPALLSADIPNNTANTTGTAANLSGTPALPNGTTATTQAHADNSTLLATDQFVLQNVFTNPMSGLGDTLYGGTAGTATRLPGPTAPNGIPQVWTDTPAGGVSQAEAWGIPGVAVDEQSGTSYPIPITDDVSLLTGCNGSATSWSGFTLANNYSFAFLNQCAGLITYTPASGTVNGNATQIIPNKWFGFHYTDNTSTFMPVMPTILAFPNCTDTGGNHLNFTAATGALSCGNTSSGGGGGSSVWSSLTAPTTNLTLAMAGNTSIFSTTTALAQMFAWKNSTAATVSASQGSPIPAICGRAWTGSDVEDCMTFSELPGNGSNAPITFTIGHTGTSTGAVTLNIPPLLTSSSTLGISSTGNMSINAGGGGSITMASAKIFISQNSGLFGTYGGIATAGKGLLSELYNTAATSQTASIGSTTMITNAASDQNYRFSAYVGQLNIGTSCTGAGSIGVNLIYTDPVTGNSYTVVVVPQVSGVTSLATTIPLTNVTPAVGNTGSFVYQFRSKASTTISYSTTYAAGSGCSPGQAYNIYPVLESQ
jgi:hypothetical protein